MATNLSSTVFVNLIQAARGVAGRAYAPYSNFRVGAALLDEQGRVHVGCNVENASYGLTICAERFAAGAAVAAGARRIQAIAIYTPTRDFTPPCGACRQFLSEFGAEMEIFLINEAGEHRRFLLDELLPVRFGHDSLSGG